MTASTKRTCRPTPTGRGRAGVSMLFLRRAEKHGGSWVADEDMSEETPTQRLNDAIRMQKRLYNILRCKEAT